MATAPIHTTPRGTGRGPIAPDLVRWGGVLGGVAVALGFSGLVNSLWLALAADGVEVFADGLEWWVGATMAVALLIAGYLSGYFSGSRGVNAGIMNGLTAWGVLFLVYVIAVLPGAVGLIGGFQATIADFGIGAAGGFYALFWALLIGAGLAVIGGAAGGAVKREVPVAEIDQRGDRDAVLPPRQGAYGEHDVATGRRDETVYAGERREDYPRH